MKTFALILAAAFLTTAASAQTTTVIEKQRPSSSVTIEKNDEPDVTVKRKVETTGSVGCSSKTVQKTDALGDTTTKSKTEC